MIGLFFAAVALFAPSRGGWYEATLPMVEPAGKWFPLRAIDGQPSQPHGSDRSYGRAPGYHGDPGGCGGGGVRDLPAMRQQAGSRTSGTGSASPSPGPDFSLTRTERRFDSRGAPSCTTAAGRSTRICGGKVNSRSQRREISDTQAPPTQYEIRSAK
jgi:hypothetical protein